MKVADPDPEMYPEAVAEATAHHDPVCLVVKEKLASPFEAVVPEVDATRVLLQLPE